MNLLTPQADYILENMSEWLKARFPEAEVTFSSISRFPRYASEAQQGGSDLILWLGPRKGIDFLDITNQMQTMCGHFRSEDATHALPHAMRRFSCADAQSDLSLSVTPTEPSAHNWMTRSYHHKHTLKISINVPARKQKSIQCRLQGPIR